MICKRGFLKVKCSTPVMMCIKYLSRIYSEVSAKDGVNINLLCEKISESLSPKKVVKRVHSPKHSDNRDRGGVKICRFF